MMRTVAVLALVSSSDAVKYGSSGFLKGSEKMRPDVVALTLSKVETEWRAQAEVFAQCNGTISEECSEAPKDFQKSCATIVNSVIKASSGDRAVVAEYMGDVCAEPQLQGWLRARCTGFAQVISQAMTADSYSNRERLDAGNLCASFWTHVSAEEGVRVRKELAEAEVRARKEEQERAEASEAASKKAAEEAAAAEKLRLEAEKKAAEEKAAEEKKLAEEKVEAERTHLQQEAAKKAEEAKHKAEEASEQLKEQQEEAKLVAERAEQQAAAAAAAQEQAAQAQAEAEAANPMLLANHSQGNHSQGNHSQGNHSQGHHSQGNNTGNDTDF